MLRNPHSTRIVLAATALWALGPRTLVAATVLEGQAQPAQNDAGANAPGRLTVTVGKSLIIDSPLNIQRLSVANGDLAEAIAVNPKEVLINGKAAGETSLIVWQQGGSRLLYDLTVRMSTAKLDSIRQQLAREFPNENITVTYDNDTPFVRGTVKDVTAADRVMAIVGTLGKPVNLLRVDVPPVESQILLKVKFANVDRSASLDLGINFASTAFNQQTSVSTQQFSPLQFAQGANGNTVNFTDALNVFMLRPDINLMTTIKALQNKNQLQMLAEPNVLAINGKQASFLAGGEFPVPIVQGGAVGAVSIMFREFGVRLNFLPTVTPRGTIRLQVMPEVSSLDYSNAIALDGFTVPALATRRVNTEVELEAGQSFVIGGLMDNRTTEAMSKIPGLGDIPLFGKLFQSKVTNKNNSELLVIISPEIVRPIPAGQPLPSLKYPQKFLKPNSSIELRQPGLSATGPVPVQAPSDSIPIEELVEQQKRGQPAPPPSMPPQMVPVMAAPPQAPINPGLSNAPPPAQSSGGK
jgi:pilus assembly protein CpaC